MTLHRFLEPISPDDPCGPDPFDAMDDAFEAYLNESEERLPQQFFNAEGKARIDPGSIKIAAEMRTASALLERSRDLRVLTWLAQFCAVARDLKALVDCTEVIALMLERHPVHINPRVDDDVTFRRNALEGLDAGPTMRMPLEYMPLARDRRLQVLTWRKHAIAQGNRNPVAEDGQSPEGEAVLLALRASENNDQVTASHGLMIRLSQGLTRIEEACLAGTDKPFRPNLEKVHDQVDAILTLLHQARPDLGGDATAAPEATDTGMSTGMSTGAATDAATGTVIAGTAARAGPDTVSGPGQARVLLAAVETYFRQHEPSSPSFMLVRQARQLQGRPLVEALELLVPRRSADAAIDFSRESGFSVTMDRMLALSDLPHEPDDDLDADHADEPRVVTTRAEAGALMTALEQYFSTTEPSSPIPLLLSRARGFLNQSFSAILAELLPPEDR